MGAGTGLVGLAASLCGAAEVVLTDLDEVCPLLEQNVRLKAEQLQCPTRVNPLPWGDLEAASRLCVPDEALCLLLADVVYDPEGYAPLLQSLEFLCRRCADHVILLAYRARHPEAERFFVEFRTRFVSELVLGQDAAHILHSRPLPLSTPPTPPTGADHAAGDVAIYRCVLRKDEQ
jgi:predicted nicotinamide N-methyase